MTVPDELMDELIEAAQRHGRYGGPAPDLSAVPSQDLERVEQSLVVVRVLAQAGPTMDLPPLEEDPVAIRLGLVPGVSVSAAAVARPVLRIYEHDLESWPYVEWRGWFIECRRPDGSVIDTHPVWGLHGSQRMAFRAAVQHLREGGCPVGGGES